MACPRPAPPLVNHLVKSYALIDNPIFSLYSCIRNLFLSYRKRSSIYMPSPSTADRPRLAFSWFLLMLANALWAVSYVAAKIALLDTSVNIMLALRMGISALVLLPLLIARRKELKLTRQAVPQLLILALVGFVINKLLEFGGLALTTASDVALLITSETVFTAAFSWALLGERFKRLTGFA